MINIHSSREKSHNIEDRVFNLYPELSRLEKTCWFKLINHSLVLSLPPQTIMQTSPGPYDHLLLILEGQSRAYQVDKSGRELTFYRNHPGDVCPINLHGLFNDQKTKIHIKAETAVHALQISAAVFHNALQESDVFQNFIFSRITKSFAAMTISTQESVFHKLDTRLCSILIKLFNQSNNKSIKVTHQRLANELGTTREVISRSLKLLEKKGGLKITRGQLSLLSVTKLTEL